MAQPILEMRSITKEFPGVKALTDVNLTVHPLEIHAICGENGARARCTRCWGRTAPASRL